MKKQEFNIKYNFFLLLAYLMEKIKITDFLLV